MKKWMSLIFASVAICGIAGEKALFECGFSEQEMEKLKMPSVAQVEKSGDVSFLTINVPQDYRKNKRVTFPCDFAKFAGKDVVLSYQVKCSNVVATDKKSEGAVVMAIVKTASGKKIYFQPAAMTGSCEWQIVEKSFKVPADAQSGEIALTVLTSGKATFANVKLSLFKYWE